MSKKVIYGNDPGIRVVLAKKITELTNVKPAYDIQTDAGRYIRNPEMEVWQKEYQKARFALNSYDSEQESYVLSDLHVTKGMAEKLSSLGFNDRCYRVFYKQWELLKPFKASGLSTNFYDDNDRKRRDDRIKNGENPYVWHTTAPTLQQVRDWFMAKYDVDFITSPKYVGGVKMYECIPVGMGFSNIKLEPCKTLREAELQAFEYLCNKVKRLPYTGIRDEDVDFEEIDEEVCEVGPED